MKTQYRIECRVFRDRSEWYRIQKRTFLRWHLLPSNKVFTHLEDAQRELEHIKTIDASGSKAVNPLLAKYYIIDIGENL